MAISTTQVFRVFLVISIFTILMITFNICNNFKTVLHQPEGKHVKSVTQDRNISDKSIACYRIRDNSMPDISNIHPQKGKSIFFLETYCHSYIHNKILLNSRQACAIESAARANPNFNVYLLFTSPGTIKFENTTSDRFLKAILTYKNVKLHYINYGKYTKGTPIEKLYKNNQVELSKYPIPHASDVLRFLTLWRYGGIYLDLDVVVLKSLENLPPNFVAFESKTSINNAVVRFAPTDQGHNFAELSLKTVANDFKGNQWAYNGPQVLTRLMKNACGVKTFQDVPHSNCSEFKLYPPEAFYPISWRSWKTYYNPSFNKKLLNIIKNSYTVHTFSHFNPYAKFKVSREIPYTILARKYCPKVFSECIDFF